MPCEHEGGTDPCVRYKNGQCKVRAAQHYIEHREEKLQHQREYSSKHREEYSQYNKRHRAEHVEEISAGKRKYYAAHRGEIRARNRKRMAGKRTDLKHRAYCLWRSAKRRAMEQGLAFTITRAFVEHLLTLGNPLTGKPWDLNLPAYHPDNPSLDQFIPAGGYIAANTWLLPRRANAGKTDASLQDALRLIAWWSTVKAFGRTLPQTDFHAKRASLNRKLQMLLDFHNHDWSKSVCRKYFGKRSRSRAK